MQLFLCRIIPTDDGMFYIQTPGSAPEQRNRGSQNIIFIFLASAVTPLTVTTIERKLQNYKPLKLTAFDNWLQYFESRNGSSKQKITEYLARERDKPKYTNPKFHQWGLRQATESCNACLCVLRDFTARLK